MSDVLLKRCTKCRDSKPATTEFFPPRNRPGKERDNLDVWCKECHNKAAKARAAIKRAERLALPKVVPIKRCTGCLRDLPMTLEYFNRRDKYGFQHQCKECHAEYYQANKSRYKVSTKEWAENNRDKRRAARRNRSARERHADGAHTANDVKRQYAKQRGQCYWCSKPVDETYHVDHVIPLSRGGSNGPENLVVACPFCNESKGDKLPHEWRGNGGKLL